MSGKLGPGDAATDQQAWNQIESTVGAEREFSVNDAPARIPVGSEVARLQNAANFGVPVDNPDGPIGGAPAEERQQTPPPAQPQQAPQQQQSPFDRPRGTPEPEPQQRQQDPREAFQNWQGPPQPQAPEAVQQQPAGDPDQMDEADREFWGIPEDGQADQQATPEWIRQQQEELEHERQRMRDVAQLVKSDPLGVAARLRGVSREELERQYQTGGNPTMLGQMQNQGLAAPQQQPPQRSEYDWTQDEDADPRVRAMGQELMQMRSALTNVQTSQQEQQRQFARNEEARQQSEYLRQKAKALGATRAMLGEKAQLVPSLRNSGELAPALVENVMLRLEHEFDDLQRSGQPIQRAAIGMLREAAEQRALSPIARAKRAAAQRNGRARPPAPTQAMQSAQYAQPQGPPVARDTQNLDFRRDDHRRQGYLAYMAAAEARLQGG